MNKKYKTSFIEANPWIRIVGYALGTLLAVWILFWILLPAINESGDTPVVKELYLQSLTAERQLVQAEDPNGEGGVSPVLAKREADKALKALEDAVKALPEGKGPSWRVSSYLQHRSAESLMREAGGK